jgi:glucose/mannose-6-phosphate isomerase
MIDIQTIKKLDSQNMLGSLESLPRQVEEVLSCAEEIKFPANYKKAKNIVFAGMGGSALGAHIIKSLFKDELPVPVEVINGYELPNYVDKNTFVVISSYSGGTEEAVSAFKDAKLRNALVSVITSGGELGKIAVANNLPSLIFSTNNNPCKSPRMGLGYSIVGQMILLSKAGFLNLSEDSFLKISRCLKKYVEKFGLTNLSGDNLAKSISESIKDRSVWYICAEHLSGNAHVAANQMNENAKRFAGYFLIPELNHHLMEGMMSPKDNKNNLVFILLESKLYDPRIQKRFEITKDILDKNKIQHISYVLEEKEKASQMCEALVLGSYISFFRAILNGIDPTAIPFVDYFKEKLKK